jgi:hypothetical protein
MSRILIHQAQCIATCNDQHDELKDASLLIANGIIEKIFLKDEDLSAVKASVDRTIDGRNHVVIPGMINTHHHMVQSLTRALSKCLSIVQINLVPHSLMKKKYLLNGFDYKSISGINAGSKILIFERINNTCVLASCI